MKQKFIPILGIVMALSTKVIAQDQDTFKRRTQTIQGTDIDNTRDNGMYRVSHTGYSSALLDFNGIGGSTPRVQFKAIYDDRLYFRAARDSESNWDGKGFREFILAAENTGNVGIGIKTKDAKARLNVIPSGTIYNGDFTKAGLLVGSLTQGLAIDANELYSKGSDLSIGTYDEKNLFLKTNHIPRMTLTKDGNIGIGVTNPIEKLHIGENVLIEGHAIVNSGLEVKGDDLSIGLGEGFQLIDDHNYFGQHKDGIIFQMQDQNYSNGRTDGGIVFRGYSSADQTYKEWMVIRGDNGNIGIGTHSPDAKLAVNGDIHTKEIRIDLDGWADYVFDNDYQLPTLKEVEKHIQEKGHLKNVPSAKEVEQNGVSVGEMLKIQQEKIEELTLYLIQQSKEIESLKRKLK